MVGRFKQHYARYSRSVVSYALTKYRFVGLEVLQHCLDNDAANYWENYYIGAFNSFLPLGYNLTKGGDGHHTVSDSVKSKMYVKTAAAMRKLYENSTLRERQATNMRKYLASHPEALGRRKEQLRAAAASLKTPIIHVESGRVFESQRAACRFFNIPVTYMTRLLKKLHKCPKGTFEYA